jgi:hypothetical protein
LEFEFADKALVTLVRALKARDYKFVTVGNPTHRRVLAKKADRRAITLRDVFGWSLPFDPDEFDPEIMVQLQRANCIIEHEHGVCSAVRVSSLGDDLVVHSRWPTDKPDSVFFGPDTYRFAAFIEQELGDVAPGSTVVDLGAGSGAGAIVVGRQAPDCRLILTDVNPRAVCLSRINLAAAGMGGTVFEASGLEAIRAPVDVVVANPPFIAGNEGRDYRDGGGLHGCALSLAWACTAAEMLAPGGRILLYTGATIVDGEDEFEAALREALSSSQFQIRYREIDPDIFGSELGRPAYRDAERIAAVGVVITRQ